MFSSWWQRNKIEYLNVFTDRGYGAERRQNTCTFPVVSKNVYSELLKAEAKLSWLWDAFRRNTAPSHPLYVSGWKWDFWFKHHIFSLKMAQANNVLNISLCVVLLSWQVWVNDIMTWTELISNHVYNRSAKAVFLHCKKELFTHRQYFHSDFSQWYFTEPSLVCHKTHM